tara:strand:- start:747 stop:956 length:210 start_codon:yes stop_codon:yes gene_type:complete
LGIGLNDSTTTISSMEMVTIPRKRYLELVRKAKALELELIGMKIEKEKATMNKKGQKYIPKDEALAKYR